eukprot:jgi/Hompol1/241/HPOL_000390-RA
MPTKSSSKSTNKVRLVPLDNAATFRSGFFKNPVVAPSADATLTTPSPADLIKFNIETTLEDFRLFQSSMRHPGIVLNLIPKDDDDLVYTEFDDLSNELLIVLGELESSFEELTNWKDDFLKQSVPSAVKLELTLLFAKVYRSKSDLHQPFFDLIKAVRLYSRPWREKRHALQELQSEYQK